LRAEIAQRPTAELYTEMGYRFAKARNLTCAISAFRSAVAKNANSFEARYNLGIALSETGRNAEAVEHLQAAVSLKPGERNARNALAEAQRNLTRPAPPAQPRSLISQAAEAMGQGDFLGAAQAYRKYLENSPENAVVRHNLAQALLRLGKTEESRRQLEEAIRLKPDFAEAFGTLGLTLAAEHRYAEAEHWLRRAVGKQPDNAALLAATGMVLMRQRQLDEAIGIFEKAVALEPASVQARMNLGVALADQSRRDQALAQFDEAVRLKPDWAAAQSSRGRVLLELKRFEEAKLALEKAHGLDPNQPATLRMLGLAHLGMGEREKGVERLRESLDREPHNAAAHRELGKTLLDLGKREDGIAHLKRAVELDGRDSQAVFALMRVLTSAESPEAGHYAQRLRDLKTEELNTTQARVLSNLALGAAKDKDWVKAIAQLRDAVQVCGTCPEQANLRKNLGLILLQSGDAAEARMELKRALALNPEDRDTEYALRLAGKSSAAPQP